MKTILIIDADLGFVFWLGQALDRHGYQAVPAKTVSDAASLLGQFKTKVDLLIANPSLEGIATLVKRLRRSQRNLKVIAVSADPHSPGLEGADATKSKPSALEDISELDWLELVRSVFEDATPEQLKKGRIIVDRR